MVAGCCKLGLREEIWPAEPGSVKIGIGEEGEEDEEEGNEEERG